MNRLIGRCLFFAFLSLSIGASLSSVDYLHCIVHESTAQCRPALSGAISSWTNAATMVLAFAVQSKENT
jgi:hypothetical protein